MQTRRWSARRLIGLVGAVTLLAGLMAAPASAGNPALRWGDGLQHRAPDSVSRITGREAARATAESSRAASTPLRPLARPDRFAGPDQSSAQPRTKGRLPLIESGPSLMSTRAFAGIDKAAAGDLEPPDPWVAVSGSHIVQSTNGLVRISDRSGNEKASIATWAMFSVPPGYVDADPRIVWDAYHQRWVGTLMWFDYPDFTDTYLTLIVSETADPLGAWDSFTWSYGEYLPDYPAVASSSDKIVVTANEYAYGATYVGSSFLLLPWSSVLAGTDVDAGYGFLDTAWNFRPAQVHGTAADLHLVYESGTTGNLTYLRLKGSMSSLTIDEFDLSIPNGAELTITPRQPGDPDGIVRADDGRIADAVWRANQLWFTRTTAYARNATDLDLAIEVVRLDTSTTAAPSVGLDVLLDGTSGVDQFTSGVGTSGGGTAFITYSQSSASEPPAIMATAVHPTFGWQTPITIATSDASYTGDRWGDYAGVAADPSGTDAVWQTHQTSDASGDWRTTVSRLVLDATAPTATAPNQALVSGSTLGLTVPVKVSWSGTDAGSGIRRYVLDVADHGAEFWTAVITGTTSTVRTHTWKPSDDLSQYRYQVTPEDEAGNVGGTAVGSELTPTVYQQTSSAFTYSSGWSSSSSSKYSGGSVKYSSTAGKYVTFRTSGRSFGFVTTKGSTRGKVKVYVDGDYKTTVTLTTSSAKYRNLAYVTSFSSSGTHSIKLVVKSGRVDIDAFVVLK